MSISKISKWLIKFQQTTWHGTRFEHIDFNCNCQKILQASQFTKRYISVNVSEIVRTNA